MIHDPIIDEIHAFRKTHAERFGYDLKAICNDLMVHQAGRANLVDLSGNRRSTKGTGAVGKSRVTEERTPYGGASLQ